MFVPGQLYKDELKRELCARWYDPRYQFYFGGEFYETQVGDNAEHVRDFAYITSDGKLGGYFRYNYNQVARSLSGFGLISFLPSGVGLARNAVKHLEHMLETEAQRLEFWAYSDNPANSQYEKLIKMWGGKCLAELHRVSYFGGKYHDMKVYEVLAEDYLLRGKGRYSWEF